MTTCTCLPACVQAVMEQQVTVPESCHVCMECLHSYSEHVVKNSWQVQEYLDEYSASSSVHRFPKSVLRTLKGYAPSSRGASPAERTIRALLHLQHAADLARAKWTQFNIPLALLGLFVMMCCVLITLAASGAALLQHRLSALVLAVLAKSYGHRGQVEMRLPFLSRQEAAAIAVVLLRAAVPLSNSLVLAESQASQYLMSISALLAGTTVYAQIRVMHMSQSKATTSIHCMSPFVSSSGVHYLLSHSWERIVDKRVATALCHTLRSLGCHTRTPVVPTLVGPLTQVRSVSKFLVRRPILLLICAAASSGLSVLASLCRSPFCPYGQNNKAACALVCFLLLLSYLWGIYVRQRSHCSLRKPVHLSALDLAKTASCTASVLVCSSLLASIGGINRIGSSPFQKTDQLHPQVLSADAIGEAQSMAQSVPRSTLAEGRHTSHSGIVHHLFWYQWIYPVPALLCLAYVSHVLSMFPRRVACCTSRGAEQWMCWRCMVGGRLLASVGLKSDMQVCLQCCTSVFVG